MTNQTITLIVFIKGEDWEVNSIYSESILKSGLKFELFIYDETNSSVAKDLFYELANEYVTEQDFESKTSALNYFVKKSSGNRFVIIQENQLLSQNWLTDFIYYYENLEQVGVLVIPTNSSIQEFKYSHALCKNSELCDVLITDNLELGGVVLFSKKIVTEIGAFDENLNLHFAIQQYLFRSKLIGTNNYYVPNISCILLSELEPTDTHIKESFYESLKNIQKSKKTFIQIYSLSIKEEMAYFELENICKDFSTFTEHFFHRYTGEFGLFTKELSISDINLVQSFCQKFDLSYSIKPFFENHRNFIKTNILIVFKSI